MAGFRLKSLLRVRQIQEEQAAGRLAAADVARATAADVARSAAARQIAEIQSAQAVATGEVRAAEQALLLAMHARRGAELSTDRHELKWWAFARKADQEAFDEFASTAHHRGGDRE